MASAIELLLLAQSVEPAPTVASPVVYSTNTTPVTTNTDTPINNLAVTVTAGTTYQIAALVAYVTGSGGGVPVFTFHGPAVTGVNLATEFLDSNAATVSNARVLNGSFGTSASTGPTMTATDTCAYRASGLATFSAGGTLSLQAHTTVAGDDFTCQVMSYISVTPLP